MNASTREKLLARARRGKDAVRLAEAMGELPEDQQEAVRLRHLEGWPLKRIAARLQRTEVAVAGLLKKGLRALRTKLVEPDE
jgi:RNA polymerase sigma-70 factor (ECF subfamily)